MVFIFEDSDSSPCSLLLKSSYNGSNLRFAGGSNASNMLRAIENCISEGHEDIIVFFDLPPNNSHTYNNYERLLEGLEAKGYFNVRIFPIICIEHIILQMLNRYGYLVVADKNEDLVKNLISGFDYQDTAVQSFIVGSSYDKDSLEHLYKHLLSTLASKCMLNKFKRKSNGEIDINGISGVFYIKDCDCDRKYCKPSVTDSLELKAERMYTELPVYDVVDSSHTALLDKFGINSTPVNIPTAYEITIDFLNHVCDSMGIERLLIDRV